MDDDIEDSRQRLQAIEDSLVSLPVTADIAQVEALMLGEGLVEHNLTTILLNLRKRQKWRVAVLISDWVDRGDCPFELTTKQWNILLSACTRSSRP